MTSCCSCTRRIHTSHDNTNGAVNITRKYEGQKIGVDSLEQQVLGATRLRLNPEGRVDRIV